MRLVAATLSAVLLLAACSGSSDDGPAPDATGPDVSTPFDRAELDRQARDQTAQQEAAQDDLDEKVRAEAERQGGTVTISIKDGRVTPQGGRVEVAVGQPVLLRVTSDADEEIHVHSDPEHTYRVRAGDTVEESFTVDRPGQVAVEAHELGVTIVQFVVR